MFAVVSIGGCGGSSSSFYPTDDGGEGGGTSDYSILDENYDTDGDGIINILDFDDIQAVSYGKDGQGAGHYTQYKFKDKDGNLSAIINMADIMALREFYNELVNDFEAYQYTIYRRKYT